MSIRPEHARLLSDFLRAVILYLQSQPQTDENLLETAQFLAEGRDATEDEINQRWERIHALRERLQNPQSPTPETEEPPAE